VQAAQTGHLGLSTLHTNDSISAITRMRDLEVPSFLIASSLLAVIAQRLVRVLCPFCKHEAKGLDSLQKRWRSILPSYEFPVGFTSDGCPKCNGTGFKGRTAIFEIVVVNDKIREMITENLPDTIIRKKLKEEGFKPLIQDGIDKVKQGTTSAEELLRIVQLEDIQ
ncbi:MAG: ATPase, T2SS/T4P/T4SS family, partial [Chitinispirillaceae bacterium]|nr:ATPase, T2SS/T4P/T4SS family [Chitinispirillaceae bacterium]